MNDHRDNFWRETKGQDLVEYALAVGMVAVAVVAAVPQLTGTIDNVFSAVASVVSSVIG